MSPAAILRFASGLRWAADGRFRLAALFVLLLGACTGSPTSRDPLLVAENLPPTSTATSASQAQPTAQDPTHTPTHTNMDTAAPTSAAEPSRTPTLLPTPTRLACWSEPGRTEDGSLRNALLPLPLEYRVHLPPCYDQQPERRYPVLYLIHGQSFNQDQWDRLGADEAADTLAAKGEISPFILVMPRDRSWAQPDEDMFGRVVVEDLLSYIDETYRTLPDRSQRAIGGLSRGAAWAVHLGLSRWELFGAIGAHSLPVFWADTPHLRSWLDDIPPDSLPRIFMDTGEKDYLIRSTLWFEELLNEKGIPHEWYLFPGYHEEAYWESHVEQYIRWYAADW